MQSSNHINPYATPSSDITQSTAATRPAAGLFSLNGRISRLRYAARLHGLGLLLLLAMVVGSLIFVMPAVADPEAWVRSSEFRQALMLLGAAVLAVALSALVISVLWAGQRLRDIGVSGGFALLSLVPVANFALLLLLLFKPGNQGDNRFGPEPEQVNLALAAILISLGLCCFVLLAINSTIHAGIYGF